jgi:hypothetical protein
MDVDPLFAGPSVRDYHLRSKAGRWNPDRRTWVKDRVTSPCIDTGDPDTDWAAELWPHGQRMNLGAFGGTPQASMSTSPIGTPADLNNDNWVDAKDLHLFADLWLKVDILLAEDINRDGVVSLPDFALLADNWFWGR